jgi:hypothetical protein
MMFVLVVALHMSAFGRKADMAITSRANCEAKEETVAAQMDANE